MLYLDQFRPPNPTVRTIIVLDHDGTFYSRGVTERQLNPHHLNSSDLTALARLITLMGAGRDPLANEVYLSDGPCQGKTFPLGEDEHELKVVVSSRLTPVDSNGLPSVAQLQIAHYRRLPLLRNVARFQRIEPWA